MTRCSLLVNALNLGLRMGDVDWRGYTIGLAQQKTGNLLTLPLPALQHRYSAPQQ